MDSSDAFSGVPAPLIATMQRRGFSALTKVQRAVVDAAIEGQSVRISSQTGSGKTVALGIVLANYFLVSEPERAPHSKSAHPEALIIVPTRELAAQVSSELAWLFADMPSKIGIECITGGTDIRAERRALSRGPRVVVATPGRLLDHLRSSAVNPDRVAHVILDEADQMLDMGFKDELDAIVEALPESRSSHMISATFPREVLHLARTFQKDALHVEGTQLGQANADIEHIAHLVRPNELYAAMVNLLLLTQGERCLVFVRRRSDATELATMLTEDGFSVLPFSGELPQAQRTRTLNAFRAGIANTLISTDVAARGIDVPDIAVVIHAEPPTSPDVYTHRSGRTGRAGRQGKSLLLVPSRAQNRIAQLLRAAKIEAKWEPVPAAAKVKKALTKKARAELHTRLAAANEPVEAELAYAQGLLEKHNAQKLVATLLEMAAPKLPREPIEVSPVMPRERPAESRHVDHADSRRPAHAANGRRAESFESFQTNWGSRQGATPGRLVSHLCRRCEISSQQIGAIDIRDTSSTFGVASSIADQFEKKASRPDERDPDVRIFRLKRAGVPPLPHSPRGAQTHRPAQSHRPAQTHQQAKARRPPPHLKHKKRH